MGHKFDINDFYRIEYICSKCSNICSKYNDICPICGDKNIIRKTVCRSCLKYRYCTDPCCGFASHEDIEVCPKCGRKTRGTASLILEDHYGYPIPSECDCSGTLRDADEGKQQVLLFYEFMNLEDEKQAEKQNSRRILRRLLSAFKK